MKLLMVLSVLVILAGVAVVCCLSPESSSAAGSVFGAAAGVLAVIWFSAGLHHQSQQLKEQRQQFLENFRQLREDNRRSSLVLVRDLLGRAEEKALKANPELKSIGDVTHQLIDIVEWPTILKSTDTDEVLVTAQEWLLKKEAPAVLFVRGIKNAAEVYFRAISNEGIDYSMEPELFVLKYGPTLWKVPYFEEYQGIAPFLSQWMATTQRGRASISLAYSVAVFKKSLEENLPGIISKDKTMDAIKQHKEAGYPLPEIARDLAEGN